MQSKHFISMRYFFFLLLLLLCKTKKNKHNKKKNKKNCFFSPSQSSPIGTTIFRNIQAQDKDAGVNGLVEYFLVDGSTNLTQSNDTVNVADGFGVFAISYPHQGQVCLSMIHFLKNLFLFFL
jgi:protocadherin-15